MHLINNATVECCCGSNLPTKDIYNTDGVFIMRICDKCKKRKVLKYNYSLMHNDYTTTNRQSNQN